MIKILHACKIFHASGKQLNSCSIQFCIRTVGQNIRYFNMAVHDHTYSSVAKKLSKYAESLDSESKLRYISKLMIEVNRGQFCDVIDPYLIANEDWISDVRLWPNITYPDVFNYLMDSSNDEFSSNSLKNYKSLAAYEYVESGKVETVKAYKDADCSNLTVLSAEVQPSQRLREKNHVPWVIVKNDGVVMAAHCSCMAGIGEACSHIAALLFKVELGVRLNYTSEKAPTEEACKWNSTFANKKVLNMPVSKMDLKKGRWNAPKKQRQPKRACLKVPDLPPLTNEQMKRLKEINPNCVYFQTCNSASQNSLPPLLTDIISAYEGRELFEEMKRHFTPLNCELLAEKTAKQRLCIMWHQHRQGRFTASVFKEIVKRKNWDDNYMKKFISSNKFSNPAIKWGNEKESEALRLYREKLFPMHSNLIISKTGLLVNPDMPYLGATPDAIVSCSCCGRGVVEIKCPYSHRFESILNAASVDKSFCLEATGILKESHKYFFQIQGQMAVGSVDYCDFVIWTEKDFMVQRITKDVIFWEDIHTSLKEIYFLNFVPFIKRYKSGKEQIEDDIAV